MTNNLIFLIFIFYDIKEITKGVCMKIVSVNNEKYADLDVYKVDY